MTFDPDELNKAVSEALNAPNAVPPGHRGAFVTVATQDGVKAVIAAKLDDTWTVAGTVDHPWGGGLDYGVNIQATW